MAVYRNKHVLVSLAIQSLRSLHVCMRLYVKETIIGRNKERERKRNTEREREIQTDRQRKRQTNRQTENKTKSPRGRDKR